MNKSRYLITSALPYANGPLHIGHLAGAYLSADIYARFQRLMGKDIAYICGSDENGAAITIRALKEGKQPQEIVDKYHKMFQETFEKVGISFDYYHRTSSDLHHETSQDFFRTLNEKNKFEKKVSEQYYDSKAKQFLADRYIKGTCPNCNHDSAYGDQCEKCGSSLSPTELINPISTITGEKPELKKTSHWFLKLNEEEEWLKEWIDKGTVNGEFKHFTDEWKNHVLGQCRSWIESGLQARSMTRDLDWGIDVPQELEGSENKKLYVWLDAPIGYISSTKAWAEQENKNWEDYWKDEESGLIHFIGKDNIVFHCIIFPAILKAHGDYILPINVPANQFMNLEGDKISTSRNWAVWVHEYVEDHPDQIDELRFVLTRNMPEKKDSEFTWTGFQEGVNNELVNNLANFVNRVIVLTNKYYDGVVPEFDEDLIISGPDNLDDPCYHDSEMLRLFDEFSQFQQHIWKFEFREALQQVLKISSFGNQILQNNAPWTLIKTDEESVKVVMNLMVQYLAALRLMVRPFMPKCSDDLSSLLHLTPLEEKGEMLDALNLLCEGELLIKAGTSVNKAKHLFSRIPDEWIQKEVDKLAKNKVEQKQEAQVTAASLKSDINFDEFMKMDIRIATILTAEKVAKADKLLKLTLDLGSDTRTVVSGIAQHYSPEDTIGKQVTYLANLSPKKIRGVMSQGMILMAENEEGKLSFLSPESTWNAGATVR